MYHSGCFSPVSTPIRHSRIPSEQLPKDCETLLEKARVQSAPIKYRVVGDPGLVVFCDPLNNGAVLNRPAGADFGRGSIPDSGKAIRTMNR